jgi:hypothetical protein
MKKLTLTLILALFFVSGIVAQQNPGDAPATKEDIQKYLDVMHSRDMMRQMVDVMIKQTHQMIHEQYLRDKDNLPPDFEDRVNKTTDDFMKSFPWDEMLVAMVPVYQKYLTKGDVDALVAFYSGATGKKMLKDMPAMMGEAIQAMGPVMQKRMESLKQQVDQQTEELKKEYKNAQAKKAEPVSN